ncbi:LysR family transcriptional regulator [Pseudonocardia nigra]|uniref:LysR family transcriptional regulator n=1 Tax=Pseudonocardia nigra TaxID=1921578 RepID=UPI001C5EF53A|nr:LysR family transcriptional regulator [Pseudonocardia nigra]
MTLSQLRAFLAAARRGSFTRAAEVLGMSQASVSELIRRLEDDNGVTLFVRGPRSLQLTSSGQALLPFAEQAVTAADGGREALAAIRSLKGGTATFGVLRNAEYYLLADLAMDFHRRYPDVGIRLVGLNSVEVAAAVVAGEIEAGLVVLPVDVEQLTATPLLSDEVCYVSADPRRCARAVTIGALADAALILYDAHYGWSDPTRRQLAERAQEAGLTLTASIEVEQVEVALQLVAAGIGDTFVSRAVASSGAFPGNLSVASFDPPLYDTIALVHRSSAVLSPATWALADMARARLVGGAGSVADRSGPRR